MEVGINTFHLSHYSWKSWNAEHEVYCFDILLVNLNFVI